MSQLPTAMSFPSVAHLRSLRQSLKAASFRWEGITSAQRWEYHAYDYAFLRVRHGQDNRSYPLDPHGNWFNETMVRAAERIYQPPAKPVFSDGPRPADTELEPARAAHFRRQDAERDRLRRQVQIHGERLANGYPTPEMLAFMRCIISQADENMRSFAKQNRNAFAPEASMTQAQINTAMGVSATPQRTPKHEDPEELRKAAIELGLIEPQTESRATTKQG